MSNLTKGRELETSGNPDDGLPEVQGENLRAKPAQSDTNQGGSYKARGPGVLRNGLGITDS